MGYPFLRLSYSHWGSPLHHNYIQIVTNGDGGAAGGDDGACGEDGGIGGVSLTNEIPTGLEDIDGTLELSEKLARLLEDNGHNLVLR